MENSVVKNTPQTCTEELDQVSEQFNGLLNTLTTFRSQITAVQQQLRGLEKTVKRELKGARKAVEKHKRKGNRKPSGFAKPSKISAELCKFMSKEEDTEVARTEVTQFIIKYISEHDLQKLLGVDDGDEVTYFNLQKYMNKHFHKKTSTNSEEV
jgi:hypothetical protein